MENALWNGQEIVASEIAKEYLAENEVRRASSIGELKCIDSECQHPILKYCNGDKRGAYFAHRKNTSCDYARFDKENKSLMKNIRRAIADSFSSRGYDVTSEVKLLPRHYTHLLFKPNDKKQIAVELGTHRLTVSDIDSLVKNYKSHDILVRWIVIDNPDRIVKEDKTYHIKRFLLNESTNKDLIVISWDLEKIAQFKVDPNIYEHDGKSINLHKYPETYQDIGTLDSLDFIDEELTLRGFNDRFEKWLKEKKTAYEKEIQRCQNNEPVVKAEHVITTIEENYPSSWDNTPQNLPIPEYEKFKAEVELKVGYTNKLVKDSLRRTWAKCELCGHIDVDEMFWSRQGSLGKCKLCEDNK